MKKLCVLMVFLLAGCTLNEDYVRADRRDYEAMQPCIQRGIEATADPLEAEAYRLLNETRKKRIEAGESYVGD